MVLITVVLPAPLGPIRLTISPRPTVSVTPDSTCRAPYPASTAISSSIGPASGIRFPEVRLDDGGVAHHVVGTALRDLLAVVQHHHPVREAEDGAHDVLRHHEAAAARAHLLQERHR